MVTACVCVDSWTWRESVACRQSAQGKLRTPLPGHYATLKPEGGGGRVGKVICKVRVTGRTRDWAGEFYLRSATLSGFQATLVCCVLMQGRGDGGLVVGC